MQLHTSLVSLFYRKHGNILGFPGDASGKEPPCQCRRPGLNPYVGTIPWRRAWQPTPVLLPGESHPQRSLVGYSSKGHKTQTWLKWLRRQAREYIKVKKSRNWTVGLEALPEKAPLMGDFDQLHVDWEPWSSLKVALFHECWLTFISAAQHKGTDIWLGCISARLPPRMAQKLYANLQPTLEAHFSVLPEILFDV